MFTATGVSESDLRAKGRKVVRKAGKQVLLIAAEGKLFAIANRCPHEGYPLSEGTEGPGCVLTCNWHNWKFDLSSGQALVGRDPVRTYLLEVRVGEIFVDLADPPADIQRKRALDGLEAALIDNDRTRMARETVRLMRIPSDMKKENSRAALKHAIGFLNDRFEDGMTHAHGAAASWLALSEGARTVEKRLVAILEPVGHLAWDSMGAGTFPYTQKTAPWDRDAFVSAVEAEDEDRAVAIVRGALVEGRNTREVLAAFGQAALAHYADFGHSAIYTVQTGRLIAWLGGVEEPLLLSLTRSLVRATREERLPEFRGYDRALAAWDCKGDTPARAEDFIGLSTDAALARTLQSSGRDPRELYDALLGAAAWNLLHFDLARDSATDNAIADNVNWLDFTHALTFANALRHICAEQPDLWPKALLQLALFVGRNKTYVKAQQNVETFSVGDTSAFIAREKEGLFDHGIVEPIIACHRIKMLFALEDELATAPGAPWTGDLCAAMNRYLNTPQKRHHGLRLATQARDFIAREG